MNASTLSLLLALRHPRHSITNPYPRKTTNKSLAPTDAQYRTPRALILVPTRELAAQVYAQLRTLADACAGAQDALLRGGGADGMAQRIEEEEEDEEEDDLAGDGDAEGKKSKSKGKGNGKGKGKAPSALHSRSTAGAGGSGVAGGAHQVPIEVLNIARDDLKPKVLRMLLGAGSGESRGAKGTHQQQAAQPDILISTPSKLLAYLQSMDSRRSAAAAASSSSSSAGAGAEEGQEGGGGAALNLSNLESLVVDEADFMLAYGHDMLGTSSGEEDSSSTADQASGSGSGSAATSGFVKYVLQAGWWAKAEAKGGVQRFLISATLNADVRALQGLLLRRPVVLDLKDDPLFASNSVSADGSRAQLAQYVLRLSEVDKFLLLYVILKLRLIRGKTLIFVNSTERGYRLKLFLEQFGITKAAVLNAELPFTSRMRKVEAFNKDAIAVMIATDEHGADAEAAQQGGSDDGSDDDDEEEAEEGDASKKRKRNAKAEASSSKKSKKDKTSAAAAAASEYSASRGVDFLQVACVINFDMPTSLTAYTHRVGRTARAGNTGTALSFVVPRDLVGQTTGSLSGKHAKHLCVHTAASDERVWAKVQEAFSAAASGGAGGGGAGQQIEEWKYDRAQIEAFRYRMEDALRSVTRVAIKEARVKEIKWEMLHSEKLKSYWEENPQDLEYLQAQTADATGGKMLGSGKVQGHLKHVPTYLMPRIAGFKQGKDATTRPMGYVPKHGDRPRGSGGKKGGGAKGNKGKAASGKKKQDPLKKFKAGKPKAK